MQTDQTELKPDSEHRVFKVSEGISGTDFFKLTQKGTIWSQSSIRLKQHTSRENRYFDMG